MAERPTEEEIKKWDRWFAVEANNRAWTLTEAETLTDEERFEALVAANAAAFHWRRIGTERQRALADLLLARVHALLGDAEQALRCARATYDHLTAGEAEAWELAFAHAILANAYAIGGDGGLHAEHYLRAQEIGNTLGDEDKSIFMATFVRIPAPRAAS